MTFLEQKLLDLFRACPDEKKFGVLETARILSDLPDSECDPASLTNGLIASLYDSLSDEYKARLIRYASELTAISNLPPSASDPASAPDPDPDSVQTSTRRKDDYRNTELVRTAQKAVIPENYQMTSKDIEILYDIVRSDGRLDPFNALCFAFDYGFVKGNRATRRGKVKAL